MSRMIGKILNTLLLLPNQQWRNYIFNKLIPYASGNIFLKGGVYTITLFPSNVNLIGETKRSKIVLKKKKKIVIWNNILSKGKGIWF